jgi:hypothetical protein
MTMLAGLVLLTPPSSPSASPHKPDVNPTVSPVALPTVLPPTPVRDAHALSQTRSTSVANVTPTADFKANTQKPTVKSPAAESQCRTLTTLKKDLHIDTWLCGAQTLNKTACRRRIEENKKNFIDTQLTLMTGLTCTSPDFKAAVLKLVMLVHCYQHDAGQPKISRFEAWKLAFPPSGSDGSVPETSVERLIKDALEPPSDGCIAYVNGRACKMSVGRRKVQNGERTLEKLIRQETYSDNAVLEFFLKVLEFNRTCPAHQSSKQFTWLATWKERVMMVLPLPMPLDGQTSINSAPKRLQTFSKAEADLPIAQLLPSSRASPCHIISPNADPATYWPEAYDSSPFEIVSHANQSPSSTRSHSLIRALISKPLDDLDLCYGYVYSYEVEGNEGYVKIGYTTRSVAKRHNEWSFNCNRKTKPLFPSPAQTATTDTSSKEDEVTPAVLVIHARRVEALCHAELDHRRIRIYCGACRKQHLQWFEASAVEVTTVIQKWSKWMATQPYQLRQLRTRSKWTLKANEVQRTRSIERFLEEISLMSAPQ